MKRGLALLVVVSCAGREPPRVAAAAAAPPPAASAVEIAIPSGPYKLRGFLVRPAGNGPFPAVIYNHGSGKEVNMPFFAELSAWWQAHGYVLIYPFRRGSGGSPGPYWRDVAGDTDTEAGQRATVAQLEAENDDVLAAIAWAKAQPFVDARRVVVAGCSFGGIHTLMAAQRDSGAGAALDFAGGAMSWEGSQPIRERLVDAVRHARIPVFLIQAENDFNTAPSKVLDEEMTRAGKPHAMHIYPPHGTTNKEGHGGFCAHGMDEWGDDVVRFLDKTFASPAR